MRLPCLVLGLVSDWTVKTYNLTCSSSSIAARMAAEAKFSEVITTGWTSMPPSRLLGWPGVKLAWVFSRIVRPGVMTAKLRVPSWAKYSIAAARM